MSQQEMMDYHNNLVAGRNNEIEVSVQELDDNGIKSCEWCHTAGDMMLKVEHGVFCSKSCIASSLSIQTFNKAMFDSVNRMAIVEFQNGRIEVEQLSESDLENEDYDKCPYCHSDNVTKDSIEWTTRDQSVTVHCDDCGEQYEAQIEVTYNGADIDSSIKTYKEED